jgi:hypothetical protein
MDHKDTEAKSDCAGKDQQQFDRPTDNLITWHNLRERRLSFCLQTPLQIRVMHGRQKC